MPFLRKYGVETTVNFVLFEVDGVNLRVDAVDAGADCSIMKDEGAEATCTNDFVDEGNGYSLLLSATEMETARIVVYVIDTATKVWLDTALVIETYGHASAMHGFDLDTAALTAAEINAQVKDVLETDTHAEPAAVPAATVSLKDKIGWLFTLARNKIMQSSTSQEVRDDGDTANIGTATTSEESGIVTRDKWV